MTYDEFQKKYLGQPIDFDGKAGVQCVDLADLYFRDVIGIKIAEMPWVSGAREFYTNFAKLPALVKNFDRIPNTKALVAQKGDVVIWSGGSWGHVAIANGEGNIDWFTSLEQNTLGNHEKAQLVKHWYNNKTGSDACWPVAGVLRPKDQTKVNGKYLDTGSCYKLGDNTVGSYAVKELLRLAYVKKMHTVVVTDSKKYDDSATKAVSALQKSWGYVATGKAGENFVKMIYSKLK
ncbi:MAG: CHAP domain-containing protein [Ruminococcus sp.]|nr:CHAP domain-containing protein [Ruminococcus sp.]